MYFHYPLLPLVGLIALGYVFGGLYQPGFDAERRRKWLLWMGAASILSFLLLRGLNLYGDPNPWSAQGNIMYTILSFLNTTKYPASLQFVLMTIGPALVFLALTEGVKNRVSELVLTFGRVSLFFYILHVYLIHLLALVAIELAGWNWTAWIVTARTFVSGSQADFGFGLSVVYLVWALVLVGMYPLCKWYVPFKKAHPEIKLLAYI